MGRCVVYHGVTFPHTYHLQYLDSLEKKKPNENASSAF